MDKTVVWMLRNGAFSPVSTERQGGTPSRFTLWGVVNVTPDSFFDGGRHPSFESAFSHARRLAADGARVLDLGGASSRPGAQDVPPDDEMRRVLPLVRALSEGRGRRTPPDTLLSVDTWRTAVAAAVLEAGADIINDISAGELDRDMLATVAKLKVPYIMMHMRGNPHTMMQLTDYDNLTADILKYFSEKIKAAELAGITDIIVDPGFGFSKTLEQNYRLMAELNVFHTLEMPLLVGISRKSMIYKLLNTTPAESLNGTTALNTMALLQGASILRVHDVKEAVETVKIVNKLQDYQEQQYGIND